MSFLWDSLFDDPDSITHEEPLGESLEKLVGKEGVEGVPVLNVELSGGEQLAAPLEILLARAPVSRAPAPPSVGETKKAKSKTSKEKKTRTQKVTPRRKNKAVSGPMQSKRGGKSKKIQSGTEIVQEEQQESSEKKQSLAMEKAEEESGEEPAASSKPDLEMVQHSLVVEKKEKVPKPPKKRKKAPSSEEKNTSSKKRKEATPGPSFLRAGKSLAFIYPPHKKTFTWCR